MTFYEVVVEDLEVIRRRTSEAIARGESPMSVGMCRVVEADELVSNAERATRTLHGRRLEWHTER